MSKTTVEVFAEKIEGSEKSEGGGLAAEYLIGEVGYIKGGMNYFSGNRMKRGYLCNVRVATRGAGFESFIMFAGINKAEWLEEAKMFSAKKLEAFAKSACVRIRLEALKEAALAEWKAQHAEEADALQEANAW